MTTYLSLESKIDVFLRVDKISRNCYCRYLKSGWVSCELESRELLSVCLKKIRGLGKAVKLVDASFIWTEPHSRRIKIKVTIQKEVVNGTILQQTFVVEFVVQEAALLGTKRLEFAPMCITHLVGMSIHQALARKVSEDLRSSRRVVRSQRCAPCGQR